MFRLTFDLELYDPVKNLDEKTKEEFISKQEIILKKIFSLLNENHVKISCFVTNEFVDNFYDFFHKFVVENHEVGCHTANHFFYTEDSLQGFIHNIEENKKHLENETGLKCQGFRSPGGIVPKNLINILKKFEFKYDSSIVPGITPGRVNYSKCPQEPYFPDFNNIFIAGKENNKVLEFPLIVSKMLRVSMNGFFFSYYNKFIDLKKYEWDFTILKNPVFLTNSTMYLHPKYKEDYGTTYLHPYDFKKYRFFDKSYIWDKIKLTDSNWRFLNIYVNTQRSTDNRLITFYKNIMKTESI